MSPDQHSHITPTDSSKYGLTLPDQIESSHIQDAIQGDSPTTISYHGVIPHRTIGGHISVVSTKVHTVEPQYHRDYLDGLQYGFKRLVRKLIRDSIEFISVGSSAWELCLLPADKFHRLKTVRDWYAIL
ncbi:hypothetical protein MVEG_11365 [Podila verticillata NRRL 6337]|uniref:Uncharacterized protein n=1 Tax=Podila verticillata NRRL 6337 TaxID=1069443 RepID=A0A086TLL3_9FUNG|nr:hypothetical protein MVEG_11365 [Podila verticillata NRRL 6337]